MMIGNGHRTRRSFTVGLALFGLFFQLLLPIPLAVAAGPGAPNRILEICAADGIVRVPLPIGDQTGAPGEADEFVEACNHCVLHAAHLALPSRTADTVMRPADAGERLPFLTSDRNPKSAEAAAFDARGPPTAARSRASA